ASFQVPLPLLGNYGDRGYLVWVDTGGRSAVMSTHWPQGTSPYQLGLPGEYWAREWVGHVYLDRPIYRPGETIQYKGIVRAADDARYSQPSADATFQITVMNPRGQQLRNESSHPNEFGSFAGSFTLPDDAPTGSYYVNLSYARGQVFTVAFNSFLVAEFRKPEFQVDVTAARPSYVNGDTIEARAAATFFFGGGVTGAALDWSALASPYFPQVEGYERYSFTVYDRQWITTKQLTPGGGRRYQSDVKDTLIATLSTVTNAKGEGSVLYKPAKAGTLRLVAEATDQQGRVARSAAYLWVWGSSYASWQITNDDTIKLVADKERYEVGDTAEVLVPAPYPGATALVTVERGKVITREVRKFATNSERLRIPIVDHSIPDVFVSVAMYWPPTSGDPVPRYKVGYVELPV